MFSCQHALAVFDPRHNDQPALIRAIDFQERFGAKLTLVASINNSTFDNHEYLSEEQRDQLKISLIQHAEEAMQSILNEFPERTIDTIVVWNKNLHTAILQTAREIDADLIIKSCKAHDRFGHKIYTPEDWHILRGSPVNVLMVKEHKYKKRGKIVCAMSVDNQEQNHKRLTDSIANTAKSLSEKLDAQLHLANSFIGAPVHIQVQMPAFSVDEYNENVYLKHSTLLNEIKEKYSLKEAQTHISEGLPEDVIPQLSEALDAELVVVGSVGRIGISAALLGNTAELIIDKVACDTLVIKP